MDSKKDNYSQSKTTDTVGSLGDAYATRSEEEGFGGIYGGNQSFTKDTKTEEHKNTTAAPEFEQNEGSEVKEKEKEKERGRNQN